MCNQYALRSDALVVDLAADAETDDPPLRVDVAAPSASRDA